MAFTIRHDLERQPSELRRYLQSHEVTNLMNSHRHDSVQAVKKKLVNRVTELQSEYWCIGPIDHEPLYALIETTFRSDRLHDYIPVRI